MTYDPTSSETYEHTSSEADRVNGLLKRLQVDSEKRGWRFYIEPPKEVIPDFLGSYRPDALGIGPEGGIIIEIKTRRSPASEKRLTEIGKIVSEQKGWDFRVFYLQPPCETRVSFPPPTLEQLKLSIDETRVLFEAGHERAALVIGWATLEAIAQLVMVQSGMDMARPPSPIQAVQNLAQEGYLEDMDALRLRNLTRLRSQVVHGNLYTTVPREEVAYLIGSLYGLVKTLEYPE